MIEVSALLTDGSAEVTTTYINIDHIATVEEWDIPGADHTGTLLTLSDVREIVVSEEVESVVQRMRTMKQYEGW